MRELKSTVILSGPKMKSLQTTIPKEVARMLRLQAGDEIRWDIGAIKDAFVVTITPSSKKW